MNKKAINITKLFASRKEIIDGKADGEEGSKEKRGSMMDCSKI